MKSTIGRFNWTVTFVAAALIGGCSSPERQTDESRPHQPAQQAPAATVKPAPTPATAATPEPVVKPTPAPAIEPTPAPVATPTPAPAATPQPTAAPVATPAPDASPAPAPGATAEKPKRAEYAPHVTIDWSVPQVEVSAKVVLREGPLELLLCSTGTKEHESILATDASAEKLFEALGLIGLTPGHPASFDPQNQQATAAAGQRIAIDIVTPLGEGQRTSAAHEWMVLADARTTMPAPRWVFCGSHKDESGRLTAGVEGTIVCVVDFDTALIGIGESHTASNAALWLAADPAVVPEAGTPCTVIFRALDEQPMEITLTAENFFRLGDRVLDALELDGLIRDRTRHNPDQKVVLKEAGSEPNPFARLAAHAIVGSGIKRENLTMNLLPRPEKTPEPAVENASPAVEEGGPAPTATPE